MLNFGGAEILRLALLKKWQSSKYQVSVLCIEDAGEIGREIQKLEIPVYCLNQSSKPYNIRAAFFIWAFLLKNRFDIVETSLFNANFHGRIAAFLAGVRFIFSEEHSEHYQYNSIKFLPHILADKILSVITNRIICCCDTLRKDIINLEKINPKKFITILSSVELEGLRPLISRSELRNALKLLETDFVIGNVSSMSPRKGHEHLLRAFYLVKKAIPNSRLLLIGRELPSIKKNLEALANKLGIRSSVYFLGKKERIADYYTIIDVFALPSLCEGIPLVILEAIKMGIPVVSTNVGGIPEIISNNETGILVPPRNPEALSAGIIGLFDKEKRLSLSKRAREQCLDRFKPERYLSELEDLYSTVLNGRR